MLSRILIKSNQKINSKNFCNKIINEKFHNLNDSQILDLLKTDLRNNILIK
jgi:hypothetical protein